MGVGAISSSRSPSRARMSSSCPARKPSASLSAFGTTIRPARSMVAFMESRMPQKWQFYNQNARITAQRTSKPGRFTKNELGPWRIERAFGFVEQGARVRPIVNPRRGILEHEAGIFSGAIQGCADRCGCARVRRLAWFVADGAQLRQAGPDPARTVGDTAG